MVKCMAQGRKTGLNEVTTSPETDLGSDLIANHREQGSNVPPCAAVLGFAQSMASLLKWTHVYCQETIHLVHYRDQA